MLSKSSFSQFIAWACTASTLFAATPAIGTITASGHFTVERSQVWGDSTLFDGALVETDAASSELALRNGAKVQLGGASRARVWDNHLLLEKGVGQVTAPAYEVDVYGLRVRGVGDHARLRVALLGQSDRIGRAEVTAMNGIARVTSGAGVVLASIQAGRSMSFAMQQPAAAGPFTHAGCMVYKDGHFILQDDNTQEVVELIGANLAPNVGNRVQVSGTASSIKPPSNIAMSAMNVATLMAGSQGGCLSVAAALNAQTDVPANAGPTPAQQAGASAKTGMSTGTKILIVAAIGGGGAGAALALAGKKSSTSP